MWSVGMMSISDTACLTDLGCKTRHHTLASLKMSSKLLIYHAKSLHSDQNVTGPNVESGRRPTVEIFKFYSGLFVLVHVRIIQCEFR